MKISIIAAIASNGVIGRDNRLPWRLRADLQRFKRLTMGHHLLVGRKTYESIGRPLPGRTMVVLSRTDRKEEKLAAAFEPPEGITVAPSWEAGVNLAREAGETELFVAGGGQIYELALPHADRLYLTRVHREIEGDTVFPELDFDEWSLVADLEGTVDDDNTVPYTFEVYERVPKQTSPLSDPRSNGGEASG